MEVVDVLNLAGVLGLIPLFLLRALRDRLDDATEPTGVSFVRVPDLAALDDVFAASVEGTVVLFLHDPYCPISARAHARVTAAGGEVHLVDVSRQHDLNREIAARTGVRHESPQLFVLRDGKQVWNASHGRISTESLAYARDGE